ncbi:hypothetical protein ABG067_007507 [Albugo candida]
MHVFQSVLTLRKTDHEEEIEEGEYSGDKDEEDEDEQDEEEVLPDLEEASKALWEDITSLDQDDMALAAIVRQVREKSTKKHETKLMK